ncbi:MAG TPA: VWA domain-containing protein [Thermoanaerobaculia bacterium]|nr:VWA domain-containing protein [Thermoanaerobaculia bacterium]
MRQLVLLLILSLALLRPPAANGQAEPGYAESIDVRVVNLEVFVTDKTGKRVTGLTREDFQVLEDGRPVEVTNFFAVGGEEPATALPEEQKLRLAIVLDDLSLGGPSRGRLLKALREQVIPRLRTDDTALVAIYTGSAVEVLQGLTADKRLLLAALDRVAASAPRGTERMAEGRRLLQDIDQAHAPENTRLETAEDNAAVIYNTIRLYSQKRYEESRDALAALTDFVDILAGLPGRKSLLYVAGGLSMRPGEAFYRVWQKKFSQLSRQVGASSLDAFSHDLTVAFSAMVQHANGNRITVYTLGGTEELAGLSAGEGRSSWTPDIESLEQKNLTDSLLRLADGTGGLASVNAGDPGSTLAQMNDDFQSYYSLGIGSGGKPGVEGKERKIEIVLRDRRDLVVRARSGHRERPDREQMTDRTRAALLLDSADNPLEVALEFTRETKKGAEQLEVEVLVKFPLAHLVLLPNGDFHEGKVSIWVSARDTDGRISPVREVTVPIRVPNDQILTVLGQNAAYKMPLVLHTGEHRIAVAVRDEIGHVESAVSVHFKPGQ